MNRRDSIKRLAAGVCAAAGATPVDAASLSAIELHGLSQGPVFDQGGPDAEHYGMAEGYPVPARALAVAEGNPWSPRYRVGAFSHLDAIYPTHRIRRAESARPFKRADVDVTFRIAGRQASLADYVSRNPITGLLLLRDESILFEHYQYGQTGADVLLGQSMTKSLIGIVVGLAIADGAIRSVDDTPDMYVPEFQGSEYGRTPIRDLLHMSSGIDFGEERDNSRDLNRLWIDMVAGTGFIKKGTVASIRQFNQRVAPPGSTFRYASIEPDVLAVLLRHVLGRPLSEYVQEKLWQPIGAEADATWLVDAEGIEVGHFGFSAVLRDYARLAHLLACDGACEGKQVVPSEWVLSATTVRSSDQYLTPGRATRSLGYGYLLWLLPGARRQFALVGQNGQRICIDPTARLVMVQTALEDTPETWRTWFALVERFT